VALGAFAVAQSAWAAGGTTDRVSVDSSGGEANGGAPGFPAAVSADGRYVAFDDAASNLVPGDTNNRFDVFVRDRQTGTTERVSVGTGGVQANGNSFGPAISADGRYVAYFSSASNLVPGDTNDANDVFVYDRLTGTAERVSIDGSGNETNQFEGSNQPTISADGRYVAFASSASNLVPGDTNNAEDIFVRDRLTGTTERDSVDSSGNEATGFSDAAAISANGNFVMFRGYPGNTNLVPGDTNNAADVFVHNRTTGVTERVSIDSAGNQANSDSGSAYGSISADGRYVVFDSSASNLVSGDTNGCIDAFVRDRQANTTERVSVSSSGAQGGGCVQDTYISGDGRYVAFTSSSTNLVPGDTNNAVDVFVRDRQLGLTELDSIDSSGNQANGDSVSPSISADGRFVGFLSFATNLVAGDMNGALDVFVRDRGGVLAPTPASVTLTPADAVETVGTNHTVTATVKDSAGNPLAGILVRFTVSGSVSSSGSCTTMANGTCTFTYHGPDFPGADLISAYADTDSNGSQGAGEPAAAPATVAWLLPSSTPGQVTGGGQIPNAAANDKIAFGFTAKSDTQGTKGECSLVDPSTNTKVKCLDVSALVKTATHATFFGSAQLNGQATTYKIEVDDLAEPGVGKDTFKLTTASGYAASGTLKSGNVQVH
jgi:Tol biopolymer transport system component